MDARQRTSVESRLLHLIGAVHGLLDLEEFRRGLVAAVSEAVPSDWVSINDVGPAPGDVWGFVEPDLPQESFETFARLMHQNPLVAFMTDQHRRGAPTRLSDVATAEEFQATDIYREFYGRYGIDYQLAFTLPREPPRLLAVALSRRRGDFTDGECELLTRARPFLIQSYRNAVDFETARRDAPSLRDALRAEGLTPREAEVMDLVAHGCANAAISARLEISVRTADKHVQNAFVKLGVHDRSDAARRSWELAGTSEVEGDGPIRSPGGPGRRD